MNTDTVTVTDIIQNEYVEWGAPIRKNFNGETDSFYDTEINDNCIFISSSTGSGKTYFILNTLLPYVSSKKKKLLYLVNRNILKKQINNDLNDIPYERRCELKEWIEIETYQAIEAEICNWQVCENMFDKNVKEGFSYKYKDYDYVICDECHYFLADSNFNTNTVLSFRFVQELFANRIRIFMSATIGDIRSFIIKDNEKRKKWHVRDIDDHWIQKEKYDSTYHYGIIYNSQERDMYIEATSKSVLSKKTQFEYALTRDYSYVKINILKSRKMIADVVKKSKKRDGKWFIFADSIKFGNMLKKELETKNHYKVVMITATYRNDEEAAEVVDEIVENSTIEKADIVISTSVMDNGINLKDKNLKNFVLLADTEVEFIQMLGRKRKGSGELNLYIIGQDKNHFVCRKGWVEKRLRAAEKYLEYFECLKERDNGLRLERPEVICQRKYRELFPKKKAEDEQFIKDEQELIEYRIEKRRKGKNEQEQKLIDMKHIETMKDIFSKTNDYMYARNIYNVYEGKLYLNLLSFRNLENLREYYKRIIKEFDLKGEDAFLKEQLKWLGIQENEADEIINKEKAEERARAYKNVVKKITKLIEYSEQSGQDKQYKQPLIKKDAIAFKMEMKDDLLILLKNLPNIDDKEKYIKSTPKKDRPISGPMMDFLRKNCDLPFYVVKVRKGYYSFLKHEQGEKS